MFDQVKGLGKRVDCRNISLPGQRLAGYLFATASALSFALLSVAVRYSEPYLNVWQIMFARSIFGVVVMLLLARLGNVSLRGRGRKILVLAGFASVFNVICLTSAIFRLPLFEALVLLYLYPMFAAMLSPFINGDRFGSSDWVMIALGLLGTGLVLWPGEFGAELSIGHLLGLAAAFSYGLTTTLIRRVVKLNNPLTPFFYICVIGCLICALPAFRTLPATNLPVAGWTGLVALALFGALAYLASNKALEYLSSPKVGVVSMSEVIFSGIFGFLLFREHLGAAALLGGVLIMASGLLLSFKPEKFRRHIV